MGNEISVRTKRMSGAVLPRLQPLAMQKVVRWLPVVEHLIAVEYGGEEGGGEADSEEWEEEKQ